MIPRTPRAAGFTLVELLIAVMLLMVGIVAVAEMVPTAINSNFRNRYDSTGLIIAQRQLEQMMSQDLQVGNPAGGADYVFFDIFLPAGIQPNNIINLGQAPPAPFTVGLGVLPPAPVARGAPLVAGTLNINWNAGQVVGYFNQFTSPQGYLYETRWNVLTFYGNINGFMRPVGKRLIISTRGGPAGAAQPPATLVTTVGWRLD
ncbi:MAG: prepilin-type N-terminal cleavage/methylation domain-containing protein [Dehalococcoidia bacterium]